MRNRNSPIDHPDSHYIDTVTSIRDWLTGSTIYLKRRNHLPADGKEWLLEKLEQYESFYTSIVTDYHGGGHFAASSVEDHFRGVAKINWDARFYEFPAYPIPEPFPRVIEGDCLLCTVRNDSVQGVASKGDMLTCKHVYSIADLKPNDLISVTFRLDYRTPRHAQVGFFKCLKGNELFLRYDHPSLRNPRKDIRFSMFDVIHISRVITISTDWE